MGAVIAKRVLGSLGAIFGATILAFIIMRALPGNPARLIVGPLRHAAGGRLGAPRDRTRQADLHAVLALHLALLQGDWGYSYSDGESVSALIGERAAGATIELGAVLVRDHDDLRRAGSRCSSTYRRRPDRRPHRARRLLPRLRHAAVLHRR